MTTMRKAWWIGLGTSTGIAAFGASVFGLYRIVTLFYDYGPAASELPEAVRAYRATGLPFVARDIAPAHPAAGGDATPAIRAALKALPSAAVGAELTKAARNPDATADPVLGKYAKPLGLVAAVSGRSGVDFRRDWDLGPNVRFPENVGLKSLARAASVRAVREAQRGNDAAAVRDLALGQRIALWAGEDPTLIPMLVRLASEQIVLDEAYRCLAAAKGDSARIARYAAWLRQAPPALEFGRAMRGEAWLGVATGRNLDRFGGANAVAAGKGLSSHTLRLRREGLPEGEKQRAMMTRILQVWTEAYGETNGFRMPVAEIGPRLKAIEERWDHKKGVSGVLVAILFPITGGASKAITSLHAKRAVTIGFAEALDAQARTGHWPAAVSPLDPFTGKPLKVRVDAKGFRVYSVGRDGKDDGGLSRREAPKGKDATFDEVAAYPPLR